MSGNPDVRLVMANRPENVALVRQALTGLAGTVGIDEGLLSDIKTAVSEACNNVVLHAYPEGPGPLHVWMCPGGHRIEVTVSDEGSGIQPRAPMPEAGMHGVGLSLIQALTESVEFVGGVGEGTEVRMAFRSDSELDVPVISGNGNHADLAPPDGDTVVTAADPLVAPVLSSVIAVLAARAGFSVERLSEAQIVTDSIAAGARNAFAGRHVHTAIDTGKRRLDLRLGPLVQGGGEILMSASDVAGLGPVLKRLADDVSTQPANTHEELHLVIADAR